MTEKLCPLLSIGKDSPAICIQDRCAWWSEHYPLTSNGKPSGHCTTMNHGVRS